MQNRLKRDRPTERMADHRAALDPGPGATSGDFPAHRLD
jgi:hypothetical protein